MITSGEVETIQKKCSTSTEEKRSGSECYGSRLILYFLCLRLRYLACYLLGMPASVACDREYRLHKKDCLSRHSGSSYPT